MMRIIYFILFFIAPVFCLSQNLSQARKTNWTFAGINHIVVPPSSIVNIMSFGADATGVSPNDLALQSALASLNGNAGIILFPAGIFLFNSTISLPDSIVLRGGGSTATTLQFNLNGVGDLIRVAGSAQLTTGILLTNATKDSSFIELSNAASFSTGDYIRLYQQNNTLVFSSWAYNTVGQILKVSSVTGNKVYFSSVLRKDYLLSDSCKIEKCTMRKSVGLECLKINRLDASVGQTTNIAFDFAVDCWVTGVESNNCNFGHLVFTKSTNCYVYGNYFHDAFAYGGGGQAYGVVLQYTSGECLIENNIFKHLRHSMLVQAGANGNVCAFNYSLDPNWTSFPSNSAGDIVMHGNYVFMNLIEENICQNIVVDASHGINGPYNTFFRNRAELYGIIMSSNPTSDNQNYIGNEITGTAFPYGNYTITGSGNFEFGNNKAGTCIPTNTNNITDISYFYAGVPWFFTSASVYPSIGYNNTLNANSIPAKDRYASGNYTLCGNVLTSENAFSKNFSISIFPNPASEFISIETKSVGLFSYTVFNTAGKLICSGLLRNNLKLDLETFSAGVYFISVKNTDGELFSEKFVVLK